MSENEELSVSDDFSNAERQTMKQRAEELRAERGGRKQADNLQAALDATAEMPAADRAIADRVHAIIARVAPQLLARTWYGMLAYADGKDVVCFFQGAAKFETRCATTGFSDTARLDDGARWPITFAITDWTETVEDRADELIRTATG